MLGLAAPLPAVSRERWQSSLPEAVTALCWSAGNDGALWSAGADGWIRRHGADGSEQRAWQAHDGGITRLCPQPGSDHLASAGEDGRVLLWDAAGTLLDTLAEESCWAEHLAWTADGRILAAAAGRSIQLWRDGESLGVWYDARRSVLALAWAPEGRRLATAANKGLHLWQVGGQTPVQLLDFPGAPVTLGWRPDGKALAVGTQDGFLQVWRQAAAAGVRGKRAPGPLTMRGYPAKVSCLDWHPTRSCVATAGGPDVVLWDIPAAGEGKPTPLRLHRTPVTALAFAPDGATLASAGRDGRVCLWSDGGELLQALALDAEVTAAVWSPDASMLALGCTDGRLRVQQIDACPDAAPVM